MGNEWHTPVDLVRDLQRGIGGQFDLDPCSGCEPEPIARTRYTKEIDGLDQPWYGNVFVNPPYDRSIKDWMKKCKEEARKDRVDLVVALIPARTSTSWWSEHVDPTNIVCAIDGRLKFGSSGKDARFHSVLVVYGNDIPDGLMVTLQERGTIYEPRNVPDILFAGVGSEITVDLDDRGIGFPDAIDTRLRGIIEAGRVTDDGILEIMAVNPPSGSDAETYVLLSMPENDLGNVECAVSHGGRDWKHVPISNVQTDLATQGPDPLCHVA